MPEQAHGSPEKVRWKWVAAVTGLGIIVTAVPFVLSRISTAFGTWQATLAGTLTNAGTTILLVALVWLSERGFTKRITTAVQETTRTTIAEETSELAASQRDLSLRLDELQSRLDARIESASDEQDAVIARLADGISHESVREALEQADALGALWFHEVTIPSGDGSPAMPRFVFRWGTAPTGPWLDEMFSDADEGPRLTITHEERAASDKHVRVVWPATNSADEVLSELRQGMVAAGFAEQSKLVDASLFTNLHSALREAVVGRRADSGAWLQGALDEWITNDWAVTQYGLEHRGPLGMKSEQFPIKWDGRSNLAAVRWKQPPPPEGVDTDLWDFLIRRARRHHR